MLAAGTARWNKEECAYLDSDACLLSLCTGLVRRGNHAVTAPMQQLLLLLRMRRRCRHMRERLARCLELRRQICYARLLRRDTQKAHSSRQ